jgi:uncharacterized cupin superfamily protein
MTDHVLLQNDKALIVDTRAMEWAPPAPGEPLHGVQGVKVKVIARFDTGEPRAQLIYIPPGIRSVIPGGVPSRHYHRTVRESIYVLSGEMPWCEYADPYQAEGTVVWFKPGMFLDRRPGPGSAHGLAPNATGTVGCTMLEWRSGPGTSPAEAAAADETVVITEDDVRAAAASGTSPAPTPTPSSALLPPGPGDVYRSSAVSIVDTRLVPWEVPGPGAPFYNTGVLVKVLTRHETGFVDAQALWVPHGSDSMGHGGRPERHYHRTVHEWVFTLDGEAAIREYGYDETGPGVRVEFRAGVFLDRRPGPGAFHGVDAAKPSPVGFHCLEWRDRPGSAAGEVGTTEENVVIH